MEVYQMAENENIAVTETTAAETTAAEEEKPRELKTLANCTPREFAAQCFKISNMVKKYYANIKELREQAKNAEDDAEGKDVFSIIQYICDGNIDDTMEICGALCFMTGEEFGNLDPMNGDPDGVCAVMNLIDCKRVVDFFTTILKFKNISSLL
jgi:hypothetical protein